jgi:hypothetical protein
MQMAAELRGLGFVSAVDTNNQPTDRRVTGIWNSHSDARSHSIYLRFYF